MIERLMELELEQLTEIVRVKRGLPITVSLGANAKARRLLGEAKVPDWTNRLNDGYNVATRAAKRVGLHDILQIVSLQTAAEAFQLGLAAQGMLEPEEYHTLIMPVASVLVPELLSGDAKAKADKILESDETVRAAKRPRTPRAAPKPGQRVRHQPTPNDAPTATTARLPEGQEKEPVDPSKKLSMTPEEMAEWFGD